MKKIYYKPIGIIHSPFKEPKGTPIQTAGAAGIGARVELFAEYSEGLKDLDGFSHIILICHFHLSKKGSLRVKPFMDSKVRGVFATRSPSRPNPIGLSVVRLVKIEGNVLYIQDADIVDGTPLLDIKPYIPNLEERESVRVGWLEKKLPRFSISKDDGRFVG
jgi:tRNA-Thr(GGU) m(6)t(6)A37 methyltransferase TsaA